MLKMENSTDCGSPGWPTRSGPSFPAPLLTLEPAWPPHREHLQPHCGCFSKSVFTPLPQSLPNSHSTKRPKGRAMLTVLPRPAQRLSERRWHRRGLSSGG